MMTFFSKIKYTILLVGLLPVLWGCSYRFSGTGSLPSGVTRIYVSVIENKTSEAGIERYITDDLITEFILRRKDVLSRQEEAEGILSGSIDSIQNTTIAHSSQSISTQRRVILGITLKLVDQKGKIIWAVNGINANQAYNVTDDKTLTEQNKKTAIQILSKRLAEKVFNRLTDDF
ncbi:MAG: LPS assembly lipoprotein LptE [Deltaproteobacteria bacterium]|nr:LPS assembly lipoprotein LptE [Deltaproteobacteria bacterium]